MSFKKEFFSVVIAYIDVKIYELFNCNYFIKLLLKNFFYIKSKELKRKLEFIHLV